MFQFLRLRNALGVLDVEAASPLDGEAKIVTYLRVVDLEATTIPHFTALSYVWGVEKERVAISCNAIDIPVTIKCHSALKHLRTKFGTFTIWIDAICINQNFNSDSEKEQQIPLMGEIYSIARITYVWLGPGSQESARAMAFLRRAGFVDYFSPIDSTPSRVWAAGWSLFTAVRCGKHDQLLYTGKTNFF